MRTIKEPEIRKSEILDTAEKLFITKGYETATVNDILEAVKIAKGTFYYYFKSKEDVLDGIVKRYIDAGLEKAQAIASDPQLGVEEKLLAIILAQKPEKKVDKEVLPIIHKPANALLHQKIISEYVLRLSPIITSIIQEGVTKNIFSTPYPKEIIEILLTAGLVIFDTAYFNWSQEEQEQRISAFIYAIESLTGAKVGSMAQLSGMFTIKS